MQLVGVIFDQFVMKNRSLEEFRVRWPIVASEVFKDFNSGGVESLVEEMKKVGLKAVLEGEGEHCMIDAGFERQLAVDMLHPALVARNQSASLADLFSIER